MLMYHSFVFFDKTTQKLTQRGIFALPTAPNKFSICHGLPQQILENTTKSGILSQVVVTEKSVCVGVSLSSIPTFAVSVFPHLHGRYDHIRVVYLERF